MPRPRKTPLINAGLEKKLSRRERMIKRYLEDKEGYSVFKLSWPDFLLIDSHGQPTFLEAKGTNESLSENQFVSFCILKSLELNIHIEVKRFIFDDRYIDGIKVKDLTDFYFKDLEKMELSDFQGIKLMDSDSRQVLAKTTMIREAGQKSVDYWEQRRKLLEKKMHQRLNKTEEDDDGKDESPDT